ncbi:ATP-dependent helicase [Roseburia sp. 499]|uniref:ATP-dependent helicase n=1 Tax=Roseburia sp. 499 TaxID=1261634 RepID=UPI000952E07A|nr:ATP-dependent helicase [Roseburia sp. 499]WVK71184.1 ATP-dependent helicase [Roseburia sp. 499]
MSFNLSQTEAIGHGTGPMLVLAGPGSGKTLVITERTKNLIVNQGVDPSRILVITFTKAAATEMKERFFRLMGGKRYPVTFGTFHAVFFSILKHAYGFRADNIIKEEQRFALMREIITRMHLEYEDENEFIGDILGEIGLVKNSGIPLEHYYSKNCGKEIFEQIYQSYEGQMRQKRLIDFDDMLVYCYELFTQRKDILAAWQKKFQYILIDEFQDINKIQFDIVKMLAEPENNLFIVGDDDQSIYRFRGAKPEIMLGFEKAYPQAKRILLDVNYRSGKEIVETSLRLISHNEARFEKSIHAHRKSTQGVSYQMYESPLEESRAIIRTILEGCEKGKSYNDFAVLFRTNTQPRILMEQMMTYNIPFRTRDNIPNLYEHWITRDILTYIRLAMGGRERRDILQIMNRPKRYITRESVDDEVIAFDAWAEYFYEKKQPWVAERIEQLEADLRVISRISPYAAINYIRHTIGYEEYLKEYADYRRISEDSLIEVLDELQDASREFKIYGAWFDHMDAYTEELKEQKRQQEMMTDCVSLATLHSSKGLEYPIVFLLDVNEEIMPYKKAVLDADLQEERRMFYVGITRAKEALYVNSVKKYNGKEVEPSRFVEEMAEKKMEEE